ncbi:hypothetical protein TIFTF001_039838 [Ficus carica]|uniref:Ubiquitin-like protease family profile domain-containing protein n=1 Tax=Ficus carica TaxID=3494 RepID=A0AA88CKD1_FICCA|nr:hypothetical protein TIFTF001_039838 [Ficus carica]
MNNGGTFSWDCCSDKEDWMTVREMITQVAFEFSFNAYSETCNPSSNGYIMKCGIHRLYEEDGRRFGLLNQGDWEKELHRAYEVDAKASVANEFCRLIRLNDENWKKIYETPFRRLGEVDEGGEEDDVDDNDKEKIFINPMRRNVERNLRAKVGLAPMDEENVTLTVDQRHSCKASYTVDDKQLAVPSHDGESSEQHMCKLFVEDPINGGLMLAAIGKVWMESVPTDMVHGVPLGEGNLLVFITSPRIHKAKLPISTSEAEIVNDDFGEYVGWPKTLIEVCIVSKTSRDPTRVLDKEAKGTEHPKEKGEKNKLKSQPEVEQRLAFDFGRIHVGLRPLAFYAQYFMKDGSQIECPIPTEIRDSDMPIFLGYDDIYEFISFQEISANCILVYLSYLSECCQRDGLDKQFAFISPTVTSPITEHENGHLRERSNCLVTLLRNSPIGRVYLTPYNIGRHWMLAIIDPWEDHVLWFDPLRHSPHSDFIELIIM